MPPLREHGHENIWLRHPTTVKATAVRRPTCARDGLALVAPGADAGWQGISRLRRNRGPRRSPRNPLAFHRTHGRGSRGRCHLGGNQLRRHSHRPTLTLSPSTRTLLFHLHLHPHLTDRGRQSRQWRSDRGATERDGVARTSARYQSGVVVREPRVPVVGGGSRRQTRKAGLADYRHCIEPAQQPNALTPERTPGYGRPAVVGLNGSNAWEGPGANAVSGGGLHGEPQIQRRDLRPGGRRRPALGSEGVDAAPPADLQHGQGRRRVGAPLASASSEGCG
jgi:hypothetical protein